MKAADIRSRFLEVFRGTRAHDRPFVVARAGQRSDAAVRQLRNGPVQGRVPRRRQAPLPARDDGAALRARRRQAQRSRQRRLHGAPPHVLRDAGQLQLRRLLQARCDPVFVGAADEGVRAARREALDDRLHRRRRGVRPLDEGYRRPRGALHTHRRQQGRQVRERQFLADGRHRPVRPVLRDLLRPRPRGLGRPARLAGGGRRPLHRDLESRVHAVQPRRPRRDAPAAEAVGGHGHGPRAAGRGAAARPLELRDRSLPGPDPRRGARDRRQGLPVAEPARDRRPHQGLRVPDRRRRDSRQRRPRLCAAPDHPPRDPPRLPARAEGAVLPPAGRRPRPRDGRCLSRAAPGETAGRRRC